jgi:peptide/nickel transport system substrate-binding protein
LFVHGCNPLLVRRGGRDIKKNAAKPALMERTGWCAVLRFPYLVCIVLSGLLLSACAAQTSADPGIVTIALDQTPDNLDPRIGQNAASQRLDGLIFNSLVRKNEKSELVPDLALSWETPDPTTYVFHLRDDVHFHDGRPLTSKDIQFTFRTQIDGSVKTLKSGHPYNLIKAIETPDPKTVTFRLKEPFAPFLWNLANGAVGIVPEGSPPDLNHHPIGSGPFEFVRHVQDQEVVLKRNDSYFGKRAGVAMLRFKVIPEEVVIALELRKGSLDIAMNVLAPDMVEVLRKDERLRVTQTPGSNYQYFGFNLTDPVFRDLRVRQALAYGIDRESIIKYLWRNQARAASGILPPNNWTYNGDVMTYPYDPDRARQLLREAGHEHLSFTYRVNNDNGTATQMAAVFQQQLRGIGVTMDIKGTEFATFFADIIKGNFQAYSLRWIGANNDPDMLNLVFHSKSVPPNGANRGHYANTRVDRLIEFARHEVDIEKRKEAYREVQRIVAEELPYISLFYMDVVCVSNKRIDGIQLYPAADFDFLSNIRIAPGA